MKTALFILTLIVAMSAHSQECEFQKNEIDKFNKKRNITTIPYLAWRNRRTGESMYVIGEKMDTLSWISFRYNGFNMFYVEKGSKLTLLFSDESTAELTCIEDVMADPAQISAQLRSFAGDRWHAIIHYYYEKAALNSIMSKTIVSIRLQTKEGHADADVPIKNADCFRKAINCTLNY